MESVYTGGASTYLIVEAYGPTVTYIINTGQREQNVAQQRLKLKIPLHRKLEAATSFGIWSLKVCNYNIWIFFNGNVTRGNL